MEKNIIISIKAYNDIRQVRNWYDERSTDAADRFLDEIQKFVHKAAKQPECIGRWIQK